MISSTCSSPGLLRHGFRNEVSKTYYIWTINLPIWIFWVQAWPEKNENRKVYMESYRMLWSGHSEHVDDSVNGLFQLFQRSSTITVLIGKCNRNVLIMQLMPINPLTTRDLRFFWLLIGFEVFPPPPFGNSDPDVNSFCSCHFGVCWHVILETILAPWFYLHTSFSYLNLYNRNFTN